MLIIRSGRSPIIPPAQQSGIALFSGLMFLMILTILGVSMFGNVTVQEKMAGNFRTKIRTFEAADSAIQDVWTVADLLGNADDGDIATETRSKPMGNLFDIGILKPEDGDTIRLGRGVVILNDQCVSRDNDSITLDGQWLDGECAGDPGSHSIPLITLEASRTICYGGEIPIPLSTDMNADISEGGHVALAHHLFSAIGDANITATHATSRIRQTGYVTRPTTGRPPSICPS